MSLDANACWLAAFPTAFTLAQARELGTPIRSLYALRDAGLIVALGRGLYSRADAEPADLTLLAAAVRAPRATLCLRSALVRHGLIDDIPMTYDLALPRGSRLPALKEPISWHKFATRPSTSAARYYRSSQTSRWGSTPPNAASSTPSGSAGSRGLSWGTRHCAGG